MNELRVSRSVAVDMESATVAANGFRYRIPNATLWCISDKPLHGQPKLPSEAKAFYEDTKEHHTLVVARPSRRPSHHSARRSGTRSPGGVPGGLSVHAALPARAA